MRCFGESPADAASLSSPTHHLTHNVWNFATVLRDDGVSYGDYLEQITFLR